MNPLRDVLAAVETAPAGSTLAGIARDLGISRDEVEAIVEYWAGRGRLRVSAMAPCPPTGCSGCRLRSADSGCPSGTGDAPASSVPALSVTTPGAVITISARPTGRHRT
ncbi:FeoC-like transcriptional regulator [Streptomyces sp. 21So2-11]|uniref:FeoC-like transcriptional regulator n=1 Tax=Streptomyces sp. 21So2-11 TaxID=3144408 RepID=UPI00321BA775